MSIKLYYQNAECNFGDVLSKNIVSFISGKNVVWSPLKKADLVAIGSLGERVALKKMKRFCLCFGRSLDVWGTGFLEPGGRVNQQFLNIHALRGMYSKDRFGAVSVPLGDPGLLTPLVYPTLFEDKGSVVCLPHLHDMESVHWISKVVELYPNKKVVSLDLSSPVEKVVSAIAGADFIVSTAMHPLIVAQSYQVPFVWLEGESLHPGMRYKFEDYFSVFDKKPDSIQMKKLLSGISTVSDFTQASDSSIIPAQKIHSIQQNLIESFPGLYI